MPSASLPASSQLAMPAPVPLVGDMSAEERRLHLQQELQKQLYHIHLTQGQEAMERYMVEQCNSLKRIGALPPDYDPFMLSTTAVMAAPGFDLAAALATCGDGNGEPDGALPRLPMVHVVLGGTPEAVSRHLFEQLRALDHAGVSHIFIEGLPTTPPSRGVMNRIHKAASTTWTFAATL
ncbi:hypothetical protein CAUPRSCDRAFT_11279 [Caulochytrium protostelioides]|uniref:Threonylcarbamoyl-AMP synthase C-terminal domain-containing protein n=1 Tax=Caulochytrium protostelioides TaxID=1555241 RepID=A0A4P9WUI9_9FUNG|nr:hypothetical protein CAUPRSCDRAFT_11279 [Caulochytrium protostelioides]